MAIVGRYLTEAEFYARLGGVDAVGSIEGNESVLNQALADAEDLADAHLTKRYIMPTAPEDVPSELKRIVAALARYNVKSLPVNAVVSEQDQTTYDGELRYLAQVRSAKADSPHIPGLIERRKDSELRAQTNELDSVKQPVQSGRLEGMRPTHDRLNVPTTDEWLFPNARYLWW